MAEYLRNPCCDLEIITLVERVNPEGVVVTPHNDEFLVRSRSKFSEQ